MARLVPALWALALLGVLATLALAAGGLAGAAEGLGPGDAGWRLARNTLTTSLSGALLAVLWMLPPAVLAARWMGPAARRATVALAVVPLLVPPTVVALGAVQLLGGTGFLTRWLGLTSGTGAGLVEAPIYTLAGTALVIAWSFAPVAFLVLYGAVLRLPAGIEEALRLDTGPVRALIHGVAPAVGQAAVVAGALVAVLAATELGIPEALRGQPVLVREVYVQFGVAYDARAALGAALLLVVPLALLAAAVGHRAPTAWEAADTDPASARPPRGIAPRAAVAVALAMAALPALLLLLLLAATADGPGGRLALLRHTWQLARQELALSLRLALTVGVVAAVFGALLGLSLARLRHPALWRLPLWLAFALPGPVYGVAGKLLVLQPPGRLPDWLDALVLRADSSTVPLLAVWTLKFAPLVALLVEARRRAAPPEWHDIARLESNRPWASFRLWGLWWIMPAVLAGGVAVAALSLGEVGATILLIPPGTSTLSVRLFTLMHYAPTGQVSAVCLLLALPALLTVPLILRLGAPARPC
jgi:iron(III) transport system permease protein